MTDEKLQALLDDAKRTWRAAPPPEPPLDAMWERIEAEAFTSDRHRRRWYARPSWTMVVTAIAAALVIGVGLGRVTGRGTAPDLPGGDALALTPASNRMPADTPLSDAYQRSATEFLGRTAVLLGSINTDRGDPQRAARIRAQAGQLLVTTRLLLDSPAASDRRFRDLLDDLELVLVQVARLRENRSHEDLQLITDALEERDVVPRIHTVVAQMASGAD
jgi:hypothetical protein